jgi:hypothetical protein
MYVLDKQCMQGVISFAIRRIRECFSIGDLFGEKIVQTADALPSIKNANEIKSGNCKVMNRMVIKTRPSTIERVERLTAFHFPFTSFHFVDRSRMLVTSKMNIRPVTISYESN